jgi:ectoine hydroxylase-related dioxygenase (phytanoyl-CoA dioxygenase family)
MMDKETLSAYRQDGAVVLRNVISPEWIEHLREGVAQNLKEPGPFAKQYTPAGNPGMFFGDYCNWQRIKPYSDFFFDSPAKNLVAELMDTDKVNLYHEHVLVKEPGTKERTPWHHDQPYYPIEGKDIISLWIPLDPVAKDTSIEFIAGSHAWGRWFAPARFADSKTHDAAQDSRFETPPDFEAERSKYRILQWPLEVGDCVAFHGLTVHGAPENASVNRRRAFSARFTGADARFTLRGGFMSPPPPQEGGPKLGERMDSAAFPVLLGA